MHCFPFGWILNELVTYTAIAIAIAEWPRVICSVNLKLGLHVSTSIRTIKSKNQQWSVEKALHLSAAVSNISLQLKWLGSNNRI